MTIFATPELQTNESLKSFESPDDLGKAYLELHGKASSGSIDLLPEEIRKDPTVANYKTIGDLAKGHIETKKLVGTIKHPPAAPTDYKFTNVEGLHANVKVDAGFQKVLAESVHKLGLSNDQADGVHKIAMGYVSQIYANAEKVKEENFKKNDTALRQEWGGDYDKNFNSVIRMLSQAGGKEMVDELGPALKTAPKALKGFARIAGLLSEDAVNSLADQGGGDGGGDAEDKEYNTFREAIRTNDKKSAIMNEKDPKHNEAVKRYEELSRKHFSKVK